MVAVVTSLLLLQARPASLDLTILHTNDLHGHIFPFAYTEKGRGPDENPSVGGAARRATTIRRLRATIKNPVILVDSGDTFTRGPLTNAYEGVADAEAMNAAGYEVAALGNNEFKAKDAREQNDASGAQAALLNVVRRSSFPWVCANATDASGGFLTGVHPYVVRELGGVRVGFLGLTAPRSAEYPQTKGWHIGDPIAAAKEWIPKARKDCDVLIALTHIGTLLDVNLAAKTRGLDAIVGGDSHTFLYKAIETTNPAGVKVPIVQDGEFGANLGRFDLHFDRAADGSYHLARFRYKLLPIGADTPEAPDVVTKLEPYVRPLRAVVGHLKAVGATPEQRQHMTALAVAEAMRVATKSDAGVCKSDGLFDVFRQVVVTRYDIWAAMPFKNNVVTARLNAAELKKILDRKGVVGTTPLPAATYTVAMIDFEATSFKVRSDLQTKTGLDVRDAVVSWLAGAAAH